MTKRLKVNRKNKTSVVIPLTKDEISANKNIKKARDKEEENTKYVRDRNKDRGSVAKQLEYIVENGIDAFIQRDLGIREKYPKPESK